MILSKKNLVLALILISCAAVKLNAQPVPPKQTYVNNVGKAPLVSPANSDFAPTNITVEGWVFPTSYSQNVWLFGKPAPTPAPNPNPSNLPGIGFSVCTTGDGKYLQVTY